MNISLDRVIQTVMSIRRKSPLSLIFLDVITLLVLDQIRGRELFGIGDDVTSTISIAIFLLICLVVLIASLQKSSLSLSRKQWLSGAFVIGIGAWRMYLKPELVPAEMIDMILIGGVTILGIVGIVYLRSPHCDEDIHHRILHIISQIFIAWALSTLLAGGITLSLFAIDALFDISVASEWFATIRSMSYIFLGAISFLDGLLLGEKYHKESGPIHKWKKILARVLGLLLLVFGVILYVYMINIIITWVWPSGEVTWWAFMYSGLVIVSSLILLPIRKDSQQNMYRIRQWMYASILPMCVMIACAIYQRVEQYGITIPRYLVIVFLGRLFVVSVFMIIKKEFRVRWMFISLMFVGVVSIFARPINAKSIAYRSQIGKITHLLEETDNLNGGKITLPVQGLTSKQKRQLTDSVQYIINDLGKDLSYFDTSLPKDIEIYDTLGIDRPYFWGPISQQQTKDYRSYDKNAINVSGYRMFYEDISVDQGVGGDSDYDNHEISDITLSNNTLIFTLSRETAERTIDLYPYVEKLITTVSVGQNTMENLLYQNDFAQLYIHHITLEKEEDERNIRTMNFDMLMK